MKSVIIVLMSIPLLVACAQGTSRALPDVVEYDRATQNTAADELENNNVPTLTEFMKDYKVMRDQTRILKDGK